MRHLLTLAAVLVPAVLPAAGSPAPMWVPAAFGGEPGATELFFVDTADLRRTDDGVETSVLLLRERSTRTGVIRSVERTRVDCARRGSTAIRTSFHAGDGRLLKVEPGDGTFERYASGSSWRIVVDAICDANLPAVVATDPAAYAADLFARRR